MPLRPVYKCTQLELYSSLDTIWINYDDHQAALLTYKSKYNAAFSTAAKAAITAAKNLPDEEARNAESQNLRFEVVADGDKCTRNWQLLKGYIVEAFPGDNQEAQLDAAGMVYYTNAANHNWEFTVGMNTSAKNFIAANSATLLAAGFMPAGFELQYKTDSDAFDTKYNAFKRAQQSSEGTDEKIKANNKIYEDGMKMCADATMFFVADDAVLKKFTFNTVLEIVSPPGSASLKLKFTDIATNLPMEGVTIKIVREGDHAKVATTDANGEAEFANINPGSYFCATAKTGYATLEFNKDVNTGVSARKELFLTAV